MVKGFYRDKDGKVRPITSRSSRLRVHRVGYPKGQQLRKSVEPPREATSAGLPIMRVDEKPKPLQAPAQPPFNYMGGKYRIRDKIVEQMPPHRTYVEPFAGAGNVLLAKPPSEKEVLNDKSGPIMTVHKGVRHRGMVWNLSPNRRRWEKIKHKSPSQRSAEEEAFLIDHSYGGKAQNYTEKGKGGKFDTDKLHQREKDVIMKTDDFATVMRNWDSEQTLHYLDPPYALDSSKTYEYQVTPQRVAEVANTMHGNVIVSYNDSKEVRDAFDKRRWDFHRVTVSRGISGENVKSKELLITNFNPHKERAKDKPFNESEAKKELKAQN